MLSSKNFEGCKGKFPTGFLIWDLGKNFSLKDQKFSLDVYNEKVEKYAVKKISSSDSKNALNKWIKRPRAVKKFPALTSCFKVATTDKERRDKVAENFLASFMCAGNDFCSRNQTSFLSGPQVSHSALSVTPENFEQCMVTHMVRRLPKATWLNDRDQFMQPNKKLPPEFIADAVIWSLFAPSNQTVSLRNVEYEGELYRMKNNFYPFLLEEIKSWQCSSPEMRLQFEMATEDRFAALWIKNNRLSMEAALILDSARELYKKFYAELVSLDIKKFKIEDWDVGYYQVRMSLDATVNLDKLSAKLLPQIYELGFLRDEIKYF